ncbi:elongation factor P maturation arginine rhamnosyltransferase EarP [Uruburuella testudinis]|uniref:Protein-arginine rhamnosyltransferase n=1 Tax=Uruburuella testudinis TaxID=1282863 RepID=A0ABY4DPG4_9NEIS|nr:elongation factor P maturation arginine rhamnosyltransferase EarP [Uruburuella testudinis]UOO80873.1 elongation factor P maturation arginine rhamnosyltransferase EarP [Uruburuella testudinis]
MKPFENPSQFTCWLFCNVIDNYGDIGVSWRLARALHNELGWRVCLWVDDETALSALCPGLPPLPCTFHNIAIQRWQAGVYAEGASAAPPPQIVIETFACNLAPNVLDIMLKTRPLWLNWEYLSAEASNERLHALPSLQSNGLQKYFWFMGFSENSGGLLREYDYARSSTPDNALRKQWLLPEKTAPEWLLFGYHSPIWTEWLRMWQQAGKPICLLLAGKQIIESLKADAAIPQNALMHHGDVFQTACVTLVNMPFVPQSDFDRLLHLADGLIIRGEDSFVRAQYAAKPFFWHIYPQDEMAHFDKLHAFWQRVYPTFPEAVQSAHQALSDELNGGPALTAAARLAAWKVLQTHWHAWQKSSTDWQQNLFAQTSATEKLAKFIQGKLE